LTFLMLGILCTVASGQCYTDPITGQRICTQPSVSCPNNAPCGNAHVVNVNSAAHCRVRVAGGTLGSGTLVATDGRLGLVVTCAHLFDEATSPIVVSFPQAGEFGARLVDIDRSNDLAILFIQRPNVSSLNVASDDPTGMLVACGFGSTNVFRAIQGPITGHA